MNMDYKELVNKIIDNAEQEIVKRDSEILEQNKIIYDYISRINHGFNFEHTRFDKDLNELSEIIGILQRYSGIRITIGEYNKEKEEVDDNVTLYVRLRNSLIEKPLSSYKQGSDKLIKPLYSCVLDACKYLSDQKRSKQHRKYNLELK